MASKPLATAASQLLLFCCGGAAVLALDHGLYANAILAGAAALAIGVGQVLRSRPRALYREPPSTLSKDDRAAEEERRMLHNLLDRAPAPLLILEGGGRLRAVNRAARALFGVDDVILQPPSPLLEALQREVASDRSILTLPVAGGGRTFAVSIASVAGPSGVVRLAALVDIQAELNAAEGVALRELLQVLSHEIMNSLAPVASLAATASELLQDEQSASAASAREAVDIMARRAAGLSRFIEAYRTLARMPPPQIAPVSMNVLIKEAARLFMSRWDGRGVVLETVLMEPDVVVRADADLIMQALLNVLANGAEAALEAPGGLPTVRLSATPRTTGACLTVEDNGAGLKLEDPAMAFKPFFTTKEGGSGVGLSVARQAVLSHGGQIAIGPREAQRGTQVTLEIP